MSNINTIHANSRDGGDTYQMLNLIHVMAGMLANEPKKHFTLSRTNSDPQYGPIITVWTNGIIDVEARTWRDQDPPYHEYSMTRVANEIDDDGVPL